MGFPWDNDERDIPQLDAAGNPTTPASTGGAGDWLSTIPMILGAGASFVNPTVGSAVMGVGDYMRRQRLADLTQQRYAQQAAQQQRTYQIQQQRLQMEQARVAELQRRRDAAMTGFQQIVDIRGNRTAMDPRAAFEQAQGVLPNLEPEMIPQVAPLIKELQGAVQGQEQAEAALPYYIPAEQREILARQAGWGIQPITQGMEQMGYGIENVPGGEKIVTERAKMGAEKAKAVLAQSIDEMKQRALVDPAYARSLTTRQNILLDVMNKLDATPGVAERAAAQLTDGQGDAGDVVSIPGGPAKLNRMIDKLNAESKATEFETLTPLAARRAAAEEAATRPGQIARSLGIATAVQPLELQKIAAAETVKRNIDFNSPMPPAEVSRYIDKKTLAPPPPGATPASVSKGNYVVIDPKFNPASAKIISQNVSDMAKLIVENPDLYPPSTGNALKDNLNTAKAAARWAALYRTDPRMGQMATIKSQMAMHARFSGDTSNIAIVEQGFQQAALALTPMTRERALGAVLGLKDRVGTVMQSHGVDPMTLPPDVQEKVDAAMKAEERRKNPGAHVPAAPGGWGKAERVP